MTNRSDLRMPDAAAAKSRLGARDRTVIVVLLVSTFVVILNETIMVVALPVLMTDLGVSPSVSSSFSGRRLSRRSSRMAWKARLLARSPMKPPSSRNSAL